MNSFFKDICRCIVSVCINLFNLGFNICPRTTACVFVCVRGRWDGGLFFYVMDGNIWGCLYVLDVLLLSWCFVLVEGNGISKVSRSSVLVTSINQLRSNTTQHNPTPHTTQHNTTTQYKFQISEAQLQGASTQLRTDC